MVAECLAGTLQKCALVQKSHSNYPVSLALSTPASTDSSVKRYRRCSILRLHLHGAASLAPVCTGDAHPNYPGE